MRIGDFVESAIGFICIAGIVATISSFSEMQTERNTYREKVDNGYTVSLEGKEITPPKDISDYKVEYNDTDKEIILIYKELDESSTMVIPAIPVLR